LCERLIPGRQAKDGRTASCKDREISDDPAQFEILHFSPDDRTWPTPEDFRKVFHRWETVIPNVGPRDFPPASR
jgi:hypothetical protein